MQLLLKGNVHIMTNPTWALSWTKIPPVSKFSEKTYILIKVKRASACGASKLPKGWRKCQILHQFLQN